MVVSGEDEVLAIIRDVTDRKEAEKELRHLQAQLSRSLDDLRESRRRVAEASEAERRRLERNLHDGAQQRLVSVTHFLHLARAKVGSDPAAAQELLDRASAELRRAHEELREIARGIHPVALDHGLRSALLSLARRSPVPVEVTGVPDVSLPGPVSIAIYYVVAEALTNVAKYAEASAATVSVALEKGTAVVEVADDGVGGVDLAGGSGLVGLNDRIDALAGRLVIDSAAGEGTRLRAVIPV